MEAFVCELWYQYMKKVTPEGSLIMDRRNITGRTFKEHLNGTHHVIT